MKKPFKNNILAVVFAFMTPLAVLAADGVMGATGSVDGKGTPGLSAEEHKARRDQCKAGPEKCRTEKKVQFEQRFKRADTNGDGAISRAEAQTSLPRLARHFERVDANKDGQVTREEMAAARKVRFERRKRDKPDAAPLNYKL